MKYQIYMDVQGNVCINISFVGDKNSEFDFNDQRWYIILYGLVLWLLTNTNLKIVFIS